MLEGKSQKARGFSTIASVSDERLQAPGARSEGVEHGVDAETP